MANSFELLKEKLADVSALRAASAVLEWDQQTYMPEGGADSRANQLEVLSRLAHELFTSDEMGRLLETASGNSEDDQALVRVAKRDFDLATKLPTVLVAEKSKLGAIAHEAWVAARANNDFKSFAPILERMFEIAREEAEHLGYTDHIYDALLDQYEEGATASDCRAMFEAIKGPQVELVAAIQALPETDDSVLYGDWDKAKQKQFTEKLVSAIGFDMNRGRQDTAPHPFCTSFGTGDVRLTTRYLSYLGSAIFGSLHEAGHGMYEQGSPKAWDGTPLFGGVSLGVHESQSRLWENIVGRSRAFWQRFLPELQSLFPEVSHLDVDQFYKTINKVKPSLIRVEADELTYNLHVMVRFEIECDVLTGALAVKDIPEAWNAKYKEYLGLDVPSDAKGCLQDVHWSMGSIGYFPTYSMGNLLSYQIWHALQRDIPNTDELIAKGEFAPIFGWLHEKIYSVGRKYTPRETVLRATGKPMAADDYLTGLGHKYRAIYGL